MRNRGKREVQASYNNDNNEGQTYGYGEDNVLEFPCKKHPSSSATSQGGICAYCLTDRLYQLVCPQCGEFSSTCSCTNIYNTPNPNSSSFGDVGNVGRISFLLENNNDKVNNNNNNYYADVPTSKPRTTEQKHRVSTSSNVDNDYNYAALRRSNSTCVGDLSAPTSFGKKESKDKFWKIGRLFRKKKDKTNYNTNDNTYNDNIINNTNIDEESSNNYECSGVTRSRSVSNFRGFYDTEDQSAARASSVSTGNFYADSSAKMSCFSEADARFSNFDFTDANALNNNKNYTNNNHSNNNNNMFSYKEGEFVSSDDPGYIDLKLSSSTSDNYHSNYSKVPELGALRRSRLGMSTREFSFRGDNNNNNNNEMFRSGSCRRSSVTERELRKCRKSSKVWRWFFKNPNSSGGNDDDHGYDEDHHGFN